MSDTNIVPKEYLKIYERSSEVHVENIMKYGPMAPFGIPSPLLEQLKRIEFITQHAEGNILDIGSDSGYILHQSGGRVGLDISLARIKAARHWYPELNFVHALAEHLPFRGEIFDTIIQAELLEHVLDPEAVLFDSFKALSLSGKLIVTVPDEVGGKSHNNPEHLRNFTEGQLRNLLNRCFDIEVVEYFSGGYPAWCFCCKKGEILW